MAPLKVRHITVAGIAHTVAVAAVRVAIIGVQCVGDLRAVA